MLIEMMGPSGSGKSAILANAMNLRSETTRQWMSSSEIDHHFKDVPWQVRRDAIDDPAFTKFCDWTLRLIADSPMLPSQKTTAANLLARSEFMRQAVRGCALPYPIVHDELLLNRAFSILLYSDDYESIIRDYIDRAPTPDAVVVSNLPQDALIERIESRGRPVNVYRRLSTDRLHEITKRACRLADISADFIEDKGIPVLRIDSRQELKDSAQQLHSWISDLEMNTHHEPAEELWQKIIGSSSSFRKSNGRHHRKHPNTAYGSFVTRRFSILPEQAQRSSDARLHQFGTPRTIFANKSVLDLGCNIGAMLLQLSNYEIRSGRGIEFDSEKVALAQEIADLSDLKNIEFRQGDIDELQADDIGRHQVVLCLAIERHVNDPERLFSLVADVTTETLLFEGNGGTDMSYVEERLLAAGFDQVETVGVSEEDIDPRNRRRSILIARKQ